MKPSLCLLILCMLFSSRAEPLTPERFQSLPVAERPLWQTYWERSLMNAKKDAAALEAELSSAKRSSATKAPTGGDFKLSVKLGDAWFGQDEAKQLADVILSYQTPSGGWSKHNGYTKGPRLPGMQWSSQYEPGKSPHYLATFDNRATTEEMHFLAGVWQATQREDCKQGFLKGLEFILAAQFPNGGWPQVYPLEGGYHDNITFNDDAMTRILELLQAVSLRQPPYAFVDDAMRQRVADALARGIDCVLKTQVRQNGQPTVWGAQHDALTLQPASARKLEPATLSGLESAQVLEFLMTIPRPSAEVKAAIEGALAWFAQARITGEMKTNDAGKKYFEPSPDGTQIRWARFYDLTNSQPIFPGRDGVVYRSFTEMAAHNKLGYDYFSSRPGSIINNGQKKWRKMLAQSPRR